MALRKAARQARSWADDSASSLFFRFLYRKPMTDGIEPGEGNRELPVDVHLPEKRPGRDLLCLRSTTVEAEVLTIKT
jgi:hypothetical protein